MLEDLEADFNQAVQHVFRTMLSYELECLSANGWRMDGQPHMAGCVGFTGELNGVVYLYIAEALARRMASRLLGMDVQDAGGDELMCDAMAELTNMVAGPVKSRFSDRGLACVLTIPSVVRGTDFCIDTVRPTERRVFRYRCDDGELLAEVVIKNQC